MFERKKEQANWSALWAQMEALRAEIGELTELVKAAQAANSPAPHDVHAENVARQWERFWAYSGEPQEKGERG
ncbi:MAG TPA: hypothetical protein H9943_01390 [Candidatus Ruthenibacterium avium]|uniref:Uncharacterized protein n=1 Tax=Candidatus Ruthenibacterium avium TaxID=2838751 RepID=A0A9D2M1E0_9FIRM|nr:hypothetical protein [Candidatus Ruthenibacterium avium]